MLKVGVTGGIGTGKSTVCRVFNTLGIPTFDADAEAKKLYDTQPLLKEQIVNRFGEQVYQEGKVNRKRLAEIVFNDAAALSDLNKIIHPAVLAASENWFEEQDASYAIKEAALLIESGGYQKLDKLILVQAPIAERIERIMKRDNVSVAEIEKRINKQMPENDKIHYADFIIRNGQDDFLIEQVLNIHQTLLQLCA